MGLHGGPFSGLPTTVCRNYLVKCLLPSCRATRKLETAPSDARFPNQNQTRYCWQSYIDFHRCQKIKGEAFAPCEYFKKVYTSMYPIAWVEKWDEQREQGNFPGKI